MRLLAVVILLVGVGLGLASEPKKTIIGPQDAGMQDAGTPDAGPVNLDRRLDLVVTLDKVRDEVGGTYRALWATEQVTTTKDSVVVVITSPTGKVSAIIFVWSGKGWSVFPDQFEETP